MKDQRFQSQLDYFVILVYLVFPFIKIIFIVKWIRIVHVKYRKTRLR